jgi:hypothetical protein
MENSGTLSFVWRKDYMCFVSALVSVRIRILIHSAIYLGADPDQGFPIAREVRLFTVLFL